MISCRIQDVRHRLAYACLFLCPDLGLPGNAAVKYIIDFLDGMKLNTSFILGSVAGTDANQVTTPDTAKFRELFLALKFFADNIIHLPVFIAVRVSHGVQFLPTHTELSVSQLY